MDGTDEPSFARPSADPELRTLETQRDTLRAQLNQLTGVLQSRRGELERLRGEHGGPPVPAGRRANGPHGHYQEFVPAPDSQLDTSGRSSLRGTPSELDNSDYTDLDFASDAAALAAAEAGGWGDYSVMSGDGGADGESWREDMMSVISRDKLEAERGSSRSLLIIDEPSLDASAAVATARATSVTSLGGSAASLEAAVDLDSSMGGSSGSSMPVTVAVYDWDDCVQEYRHRSSTRVAVDMVEPQARGAAGRASLTSAEAFYGIVQRVVGWKEGKHGSFRITDCVASDGPAPDVFGGCEEGGEGEDKGAQPLLDAFTVRGLGLWHGCVLQVRRPHPDGDISVDG